MGKEPPEIAQSHLVSVTIPPYNEAPIVPFALESVFKQTYPFIEAIIVDGRSSDRTKDTAFEFELR